MTSISTTPPAVSEPGASWRKRAQGICFALLMGLMPATLSSCATIPKGAKAVEHFEKARYLGKWYEIARLDFRFERDMDNTTAEYSLNPNGSLKVDNKGYNTKKAKWERAIGKAKFVGAEDVAMLKVSFFGPFYAGYNVLAIDDGYKYALVAGRNLDYLWILSRETVIPPEVKGQYLALAEKIGYKTGDLVWVNQDGRKAE